MRRWIGSLLVVWAALDAAAVPGPGTREVFLEPPRPGVAVLASTYYSRAEGAELLSVHQLMSRSDTVDVAQLRRSPDGGRTWTDLGEFRTRESRPGGTFRRALRGGVADPRSGRFVRFHLEALLPSDDPLEGMRQWYVCYGVSPDGGRSWPVNEQVIQSGPEFSPTHPLPGVWIGRNCVMIGDLASMPLFLADGTLLVPVIITPLGPDGTYHNPGGGYTYSDAAVLLGRWRADGRLDWEVSARIEADPALSTRGLDEPTVAPLEGGRLLLLARGSNSGKPGLPGRRWAALSGDGGRTWTSPRPWTYADGGELFSPSACSQLLPHSSGRLFWIGNLSPRNPEGNHPRYPLVLGEVDRSGGGLRRETVRVIDDRGPADGPLLALSNFSAREDRATGDVVVNLTRLFATSTPEARDWTAPAFLYRVPVPAGP